MVAPIAPTHPGRSYEHYRHQFSAQVKHLVHVLSTRFVGRPPFPVPAVAACVQDALSTLSPRHQALPRVRHRHHDRRGDVGDRPAGCGTTAPAAVAGAAAAAGPPPWHRGHRAAGPVPRRRTAAAAAVAVRERPAAAAAQVWPQHRRQRSIGDRRDHLSGGEGGKGGGDGGGDGGGGGGDGDGEGGKDGGGGDDGGGGVGAGDDNDDGADGSLTAQQGGRRGRGSVREPCEACVIRGMRRGGLGRAHRSSKAQEDVRGSSCHGVARSHSHEGDRPRFPGAGASLGLLGLLGAPARRAR